jgi:hypothetical protein
LTFSRQCQTCVSMLIGVKMRELSCLEAATAIGFGQYGTYVTVYHSHGTVLRSASQVRLKVHVNS